MNNRNSPSQVWLFIAVTIFFTGVVFIIKNYFFMTLQPQMEEQLIETDKTIEEYKVDEPEDIFEKDDEKVAIILKDYYASAAPFMFHYFPDNFEEIAQDYSKIFWDFLSSDAIKKSVFDLHVQIHQNKYDVRGKMKNKSIKMYGIEDLSKEEFLAVAIHEFAHFVDIYYFQKKVIRDLSENFYGISWESTKVMQAGLKQSDFVSWYAMTNKYEDFAESFTYYVLHNKDFLQKAEKSEILMKKYKYFWVYFFKKDDFKQQDFSIENEVLDYYRDITKIPFDIENLLQYLKKWI